MTLFSLKNSFIFGVIVCVSYGHLSFAQESQTLSVSPTLFEMQASPSQTWQSEIRVINVNEYDLTVYPEVVNFAPIGEDGRGDLLPIMAEETAGQTLAEWVQISAEPIFIPRQQTVTVPVTITVPENAAPGGHYAAILIGTRQQQGEEGASLVQTAQFVSSLLFVRVAGDVVEDADIRELTTAASVVQKPEISIDLRFENSGNVHVQPQGDIKIFNMWGEERGIIPINHQTHFGNVLPNSIRKFSFAWKGETSLLEIGRYRVVATLGYGTDKKQFVTATTYFWVVPYVTLFLIVFGLFVTVKIGLWFVRRYIERMLLLSGVPLDPHRPYVPHHARSPYADKTVVIARYQTLAPLRAGVADVVSSWRSTDVLKDKITSSIQSLLSYRLFLLGCATIVIIIALVSLFISRNNAPTAAYEVSYTTAGSTTTLSGEDVTYNQLRLSSSVPPPAYENQPVLHITNISGRTGVAGRVKFKLEQQGYTFSSLQTDPSRTENRTVIIYPVMHQDFALELSKSLNGALLSAATDASVSDITILVGSDKTDF